MNKFFVRITQTGVAIYIKMLKEPKQELYIGDDSTFKLVKELKKKLGTSCMKDFNFHTAHIKYTVGKTLVDMLGEAGEKAVAAALKDYVDTFGQEYLDVLDGLYPME